MRVALIVLGAVVAAHLVLAPYNKVEESFNIQATHDILYHGLDVAAYDHKEFPGVVPRTFAGAFSLAALSTPFKFIMSALGLDKIFVQYAVRGVLGLVALVSFAALANTVETVHGSTAATFLLLLTAIQFHLPFYMSRLLPNILALVVTNFGIAAWVSGKPYRALAITTFAAVVFRCDMLLLVACLGLQLVLSKQVSIPQAALHCIGAAAAGLAISVALDSLFWGRLVWPEGEVFWFNTVLNKSSEWGVSSPHWYFTSALPRALHIAYPLAFFAALINPRARPVLGVAVVFTILYSYLPHKEVRFLFPSLPLWNLAAALAAADLWKPSPGNEKRAAAVLKASLIGGMVVGAGITALSTACSIQNYPGGEAFKQFHALTKKAVAHNSGRTFRVHIDTLPAMTGVSRFGQHDGSSFVYSKKEGLSLDELVNERFDFLITGYSSVPGHYPLATIDGFSHIRFETLDPLEMAKILLSGRLPIVEIVTQPQVYIWSAAPLQSLAKTTTHTAESNDVQAGDDYIPVASCGGGGAVGSADYEYIEDDEEAYYAPAWWDLVYGDGGCAGGGDIYEGGDYVAAPGAGYGEDYEEA